MDLSIIIPALNEEAKIRRDIDAAYAFVVESRLNAEIIIVADGSTDGTFQVAQAATGEVPVLRVLALSDQRGKGAAVKRGFSVASGAIVMFADAGLCVPFNTAQQGIELIQSRACDMAHGSRSHPRAVLVRMQPPWRRWGSRAFRYCLASFMGIPWSFGDTQCGFKLYRIDAARALYSQLFTHGYMFDIEIILRARKQGYRIGQFPVTWTNDADSRYDPIRGTVQVLKHLLAIRFRLAFDSTLQPARTHQNSDVSRSEHG